MRTNAAKDRVIVISTLKDGHMMTQSSEHVARPYFFFLYSPPLCSNAPPRQKKIFIQEFAFVTHSPSLSQ